MKMFIGKEVEHTNLYGELTLFVPGEPSLYQILEVVKQKNISHVYLGANQSFNNFTKRLILDTCKFLTSYNIKVTVDFDQKYYDEVREYFATNIVVADLLYLNISCKLQHIDAFKHVSIKVDDDTLNKSNAGVWTFPIGKDNFTPWSAYNEDKEVD